MGRIQTAIHCGTPDRVPLSLVLDTFACNTMGVKYSEFCADLDVAGADDARRDGEARRRRLRAVGHLRPGRARHAVARADEAPRPRPARATACGSWTSRCASSREDYDRSSRWAGGRGSASTSASTWARRPRPARRCRRRRRAGSASSWGAATSCSAPRRSTTRTSTSAAAGRSRSSPWTCSRGPDKVQAAMDAIMAEKREQTRQMVRAIGQPVGYWVGSWRTAPQFLSPKLWDRFVWPYMKELVEIVAEEGGIPDAALRRQLGPRDRAAARAAGAHLRARHRRQAPTSSAPRRSWAGTCASWATCRRRC